MQIRLSSQMSAFELCEKCKKLFLMSNPNPSSDLKQVNLYFSLCYITLILLVQNMLDPVYVVNDSSISSWAPNCTTLVAPWSNAKEFPVLLPR